MSVNVKVVNNVNGLHSSSRISEISGSGLSSSGISQVTTLVVVSVGSCKELTKGESPVR